MLFRQHYIVLDENQQIFVGNHNKTKISDKIRKNVKNV